MKQAKKVTRRRRGRPVVGEAKRLSFTMRITQSMRDRLEAASRESKRSLAQEAEFWLEHNERSFKDGMLHAFGQQSAGVLQLIGRVLEREGDWLADPGTFGVARDRINAVLAALAPPGTPKRRAKPRASELEAATEVRGLLERLVPAGGTRPAVWVIAHMELRFLLGDDAMARLRAWCAKGGRP